MSAYQPQIQRHPPIPSLPSSSCRAKAQYFRQSFLPTAPICRCKCFPVYRHKLGTPSLPNQSLSTCFDHLCLNCIERWAHRRFNAALHDHWNKELEEEYWAYYTGYYSKDEGDAIIASHTDKQHTKREAQSLCLLEPLLKPIKRAQKLGISTGEGCDCLVRRPKPNRS